GSVASGYGASAITRWRIMATTATLPGVRARERGGGTRERSIDVGAPLWSHGRAVGRPGAPLAALPKGTTMRFTSEQRLDDGVLEREFTLGEVPGVLWTP